MKILITGGMGFIGSHLARRYLAICETIYIVDNLSTHTLSPDSDFITQNKKIVFLKMDLSTLKGEELSNFESILSSVSVVFHFASPVGVKYIDDNPKVSFQSLCHSTFILFPLFEKYKNKVIYASSSEVYGETSDAHESDILKIGAPTQLRWGYACGKLMSEFMLRTYNFPYVILRFFNISGKNQLSRFGMVMPHFIESATKNEDLQVFGTGEQIRSFCDVRDAVEMINLLSHDVRHEGETYNIGNPDNMMTILELAKLVINKTQGHSKIIHKDFDEIYSANTAELYIRKINNSKISQIYQCQYKTEDIIDSMLSRDY